MNTNLDAFEADDERAGRRSPACASRSDGNRAARWGVLLDRAARGDTAAFAAFYDESSSVAFSLILFILRDGKAAEDTLLDVYAQVWARLGEQAHRERNPVAWVIGLARGAAVARLRQTGRSRGAGHQTPPSASSVSPFEPFHRERQQVARAAGRLTPEQRSLLHLTYFGGITAREAAEQLGLPPERAAGEIRLAMGVLRSSCESDAGDEERGRAPGIM